MKKEQLINGVERLVDQYIAENIKDQEKEDWPQKGDKYCTLDSKGSVFITYRDGEEKHFYRKRRKNIFRIEEEEQAEKFQEVESKIYEISERYGKIDWTDDRVKYYLSWTFYTEDIQTRAGSFFIPGVIYCNYSHFAGVVYETILKKDLKFYFCHLAGVKQ